MPSRARLRRTSFRGLPSGASSALAQAECLNRESPIGFVHPLVRDAVYDELPAGERELRHTRAAQILQEDAGAGPDELLRETSRNAGALHRTGAERPGRRACRRDRLRRG